MATITTLNSGDSGPVSRGVINTNFTNLNTDKAELNSPTFTGTPSLPTGTTAVTQSPGDNSTKVATTAYVDSGVVTGFADTEVYNAAMTTDWVDLDLSAVIGVAQKVVLLRLHDSGATAEIALRTNGDTHDYSTNNTTQNVGLSEIQVLSGAYAGTTIVKTDSNGVIEIKSSGTANLQIDVLAYW